MTDVSLPAAFGAGLISFVSPCVLPLAAPYLCYLAGASVEALVDEGENEARRDILDHRAAVRCGIHDRFVAFGATASAFGAVFRQWSHWLSIAAGVGVILMGLHFLGIFRFAAMLREARLEIERPAGVWSAYPMGMAFALGWTPCIGPILATILAVAGSEQTVGAGALLLAVYSLGLGVPFIVAAAAMGPFMRASGASKAIRRDREGGRRPAGLDRRRLPHRRLPERLALADRDVSAVRADGVAQAARAPPSSGDDLGHLLPQAEKGVA